MYSYPMLFVSASTNQQEVRRDACHLRSLTTRQGFIPLNSVQVRDRGGAFQKSPPWARRSIILKASKAAA